MPKTDLKLWKQILSKLWNNADLSKDRYNYDMYYEDDPIRAWKQLWLIKQGKAPHFKDDGKSGIYKLPNHETYPWLGNDSWSNNDTVYHLSKDQYFKPEDVGAADTDETLAYLGRDYRYNNGGTKVMYEDYNVLPTVWVYPNHNVVQLKPNKTKNGYVYTDE